MPNPFDIKEPALPPLHHLQRALRLSGARAMCIHRAAAFVFDVPASKLVFATMRGATPEEQEAIAGASLVPFIHAWAEFRGFVYAPTTIEAAGRLNAIPRQLYVDWNGAHDFHQLTRAELLRLDRKLGLKRVLRTGGLCKGGQSFGGSLLDAAGVRYQLASDGELLPVEGVQANG